MKEALRIGTLLVLSLGLLPICGEAQQWPDSFDRPTPSDRGTRTGPDVGEKIPPFEGIDQQGRRLDFDAIKGPKGALLLFYRSADW